MDERTLAYLAKLVAEDAGPYAPRKPRHTLYRDALKEIEHQKREFPEWFKEYKRAEGKS